VEQENIVIKKILLMVCMQSALAFAVPPSSLQKNVQCAHEIRNLFSGDPNFYIGYKPKPFFILFPEITKMSQPLVISASQVGMLTQPTNLNDGFQMDGLCLKRKPGEAVSGSKEPGCPETTIQDQYGPEIYNLFRDRLIAAIQKAKQRVDEYVKSETRSERYPPSAEIVGHIIRSELKDLKKCSAMVTDPDVKTALADAISAVGIPPDEPQKGQGRGAKGNP
jgi:hypothetical protein